MAAWWENGRPSWVSLEVSEADQKGNNCHQSIANPPPTLGMVGVGVEVRAGEWGCKMFLLGRTKTTSYR